MKGGQISRIWGRQVSFSLAAIFFTTVFFWSWENNPILTSLSSPQEQFVMHTPDLYVDDSADSSMLVNPKNRVANKNSDAQLPEGTENGVVERSDHDVNREIMVSRKREGQSQIPALSFEKQATCNYAKGKWVKDSRRPLYSGFGCKQWLSDMWACRLTQRPNFSYESYRWQPNNCKMRDFHPQEFLRRMQDKTIAFIGDSLGRQQFQSLMCMVTGGEENPEIENIGWKFGLVKPRGAVRPDGWAYRFPTTNTTILYYWSASLCNIEPINSTDPNTDFAMHLDQPPFFLSHHLPQFDVVVLNTGHHWNRGKINGNKWVMYANGKPVTDRKLAQIANAKNLTVHSISRWLDSKVSTNPKLKAFFRTISPRHFSNGDWNSGGSCDNLTPLTRGSEVLKDESSDPDIESAVKGTKVKILDITALSELRDECHISRYSIKASEGINDCLHWCLPGVPDTWNELLYAQL